MIKLVRLGTPIDTEAVIDKPTASGDISDIPFGIIQIDLNEKEKFKFEYNMESEDIVYGLGEANRGINKRGYIYKSLATDEPNHTEDKISLYGVHNFIVISGKNNFGIFFDCPAPITFDIGYTNHSSLCVTCSEKDMDIYFLTGESAYGIVKEFRGLIGQSYIPPKFAFGFGQSRWGYMNKTHIENVVKGYRNNNLPLDMVYLDIDYMKDFKDFTIDEERFPDFKDFVKAMKDEHIHLIPIIDAGVKIEKGYDVYEEGVKNNYFCKREDGSDFAAVVWPGWTHFPDVLNSEARDWFGCKYKCLTDMGIDGFWNDMNEPAIFRSVEGEKETNRAILEYAEIINENNSEINIFDSTGEPFNTPRNKVQNGLNLLQNNHKDYERFYHNMNGRIIRHDKVHNLYGFNMTRAASEAFKKIAPDKDILLFSRSSYIGMHRYGGIWTGDNHSWWSHILLNLKMLPSLNMCGFLYVGADLGGFNANTTRELLLRWMALGVFTPLMRNHAALGTREQECYNFEDIGDFRAILNVRYRLVPYLYSEFLKASRENEMYFRPMGFDYPQDKYALHTEDQLMLGHEAMIAPVYTANAIGRTVYLPEEMKYIRFMADGSLHEEIMDKGYHFIEVALNEVPLFIKKNCCIPIVDAATSVDTIDISTLSYIGYENATYELISE